MKMLSEHIVVREVEVAIKETRKNTSPGADGLNYEFYKL